MTVIKTLWKNRRHFKMQIFGITVSLIMMAFLINLLSIKISYNNKIDTLLSTNVRYTETFSTSLSGATGVIDNIFVDSSKTRCFILATMSNTSLLAMDASKYQVFLTNAKADGSIDKKPVEQITGEIYMFGTSGRVGLYFKSDVPFTNALKKVTLRSYKQYAQQTTPYFVSIASDAQYDQCHFYFNPGGASAQTIAFLETHIEGSDFDLSEMYRQITTTSAYEEVRKQLSECQNDMVTLYGKMAEYRERLTNTYNLSIPENPAWIKGDKFEDVVQTDENGNVISYYRKFVPNVIFPGGTDYDWYLGSVDEGYYHLISDSNGLSLRDYLLKLASKSGDIEKADFDTWYYTDGTPVVFTEKYVTNFELEMKSTIEEYKALFDEYKTLKQKLQTQYLPKLLELEFESETMGQSYTVHRGESALVLY